MKQQGFAILLMACLNSVAVGQEIDLSIITRIKAEAFSRSRVMDNAFYLTDVHGPRLTGSPGFDAAADWAAKRLSDYGLVDIRREPFEWGRGWTSEHFYAELTAPQHASLIGLPLPWSTSTDGAIEDVPIHAPFPPYSDWSDVSFQQYFEAYQGRLQGKIVLIEPYRPHSLVPEIPSTIHRFTAEELESIKEQPIPETPSPGPPGASDKQFEEFADELIQFYNAEGVRLLVFKDWGNGGGVMALSHALGSTWLHLPDSELPPPMIGLLAEHYDRILRLVNHGIPVRLRTEVRTHLKDSVPTFSLTADIPGVDKRDELVMIGAHLDSWTLGTGATDNAAGVAVMMEAVRILQALDLQPRRTIRIALWGGHEGEGTGSRTYVSEHFGTVENPKRAHGKLSVYFNLDNGTGRIRGIYLEENEKVRPIFERWFEPFHSVGAKTVAIRGMAGTDHRAFVAAGLPGFQFIQDPVDYARTHHTNMDLYDHLHEADLKQASAIIATFAYLAATRDALLPRKPIH